MNKQDSGKAARNDSTTSKSHCAVTEELFSAIQLQNDSNIIETSNLRHRNDTTEISANEIGHRSDTDTHGVENNAAIETPYHLTSLEVEDKFSNQSDHSNTGENNYTAASEHSAVPSVFKPHKVNFRPLRIRTGETTNNPCDNVERPSTKLKTEDKNMHNCNPVSTGKNSSDNYSRCGNDAVCASTNTTKSFQPVIRRTRNKPFKRSCAHILNSRMSSTDDALSVISEESLSSADIKSLSGAHRLSMENAPAQLQTQNKAVQSHSTSKTNAVAPLADPWVRPSITDPGGDARNSNSSDPSYNSNDGAGTLQASQEPRSTRLRFQAESQNELHTIESNEHYATGNRRNRMSDSDYENREKERNDIDLLTRPSWCDAKFALSRIEQVYFSFNL